MLLRVDVRVVESLQAVSQTRRIEIEQQARGTSRQLEIGDDLRLIDGMKTLRGFDLDDRSPINQQIEPQVAANALSAIKDRHGPLDLRGQMRERQLYQQTVAIDRLEQSWTECAVHRDGATDDFLQ